MYRETKPAKDQKTDFVYQKALDHSQQDHGHHEDLFEIIRTHDYFGHGNTCLFKYGMDHGLHFCHFLIQIKAKQKAQEHSV